MIRFTVSTLGHQEAENTGLYVCVCLCLCVCVGLRWGGRGLPEARSIIVSGLGVLFQP